MALLLWGLLLGIVYRALTRAPLRACVVLAVLVVSHWVLDVIVHRPDLPFSPGLAPRVGPGLWNSYLATVAVEFALYGAGVGLYLKATEARDRIGSIGLTVLLVFFAVLELANLFGPAPPNVDAVVISAQAMWLLVILGYWISSRQ